MGGAPRHDYTPRKKEFAPILSIMKLDPSCGVTYDDPRPSDYSEDGFDVYATVFESELIHQSTLDEEGVYLRRSKIKPKDYRNMVREIDESLLS